MTILKRGSKGAAVKTVQELLNRKGYALIVDGVFGQKTEDAVRSFQKKFLLVVDGKVGTQTMTALRQAVSPPPTSGKKEPDKSAMSDPVPGTTGNASYAPAPPINGNDFKIVQTTRPFDTVVIHCAATPEGKDYTVNDIRAWHKQRGFSDIGYHYVVYRDGSIHAGRPLGQIGAHVEGHNTGTVGVCYIGGVTADGKTPKDTRTPAQKASLLWLVRELARHYPKLTKVRGHNDYTNAKACPSFKVGNDPLGKALPL